MTFPQVLQRHVRCPPVNVTGRTVREALEAAFESEPRVRRYVLEDDGALRRHMAVFVDGRPVRDRRALSDSIEGARTIDILQALSGG